MAAFIDAFAAIDFEKNLINILILRIFQPLINDVAYIIYTKMLLLINQL